MGKKHYIKSRICFFPLPFYKKPVIALYYVSIIPESLYVGISHTCVATENKEVPDSFHMRVELFCLQLVYFIHI